MRKTSILRRLCALLALTSFVFGAAALDHSLFRCHGDAQVRRECCCPKVESEEPPATAIAKPGCCDVEQVHLTQVPSEARRTTAADVACIVELSPAPTISFTLGAAIAAPPSLAAPGLGPPLILIKSSFLI